MVNNIVKLETETERTDGVTYVKAIVTNPRGTAQRVKLQSQIDGPTWPPQLGGIIAPNWHDDVWEGTIRAGQSRGVGFASSGNPVDPPMEVISVERAPQDKRETVDQVLSTLEAWSPPSNVVGSREKQS